MHSWQRAFVTYLNIPALYGVLFESDEEAAFSNYRLWESLGFIFAYILQTQVTKDSMKIDCFNDT